MPAERAVLAAQTAQARATLSQRGVSLDSQTTFVAVAPMDGTVVAVSVERGQGACCLEVERSVRRVLKPRNYTILD